MPPALAQAISRKAALTERASHPDVAEHGRSVLGRAIWRLSRWIRDFRTALWGGKRGQRRGKEASELGGKGMGWDEWEVHLEEWQAFFHAHFACKFEGAVSVMAQREHVARWESIAVCQRRGRRRQ